MKFQFRKIEFNWYILVSLILGVLALVMYFFPFFSYTSPSEVEDQYYYSGFELTQAMFWNEENLDITDPNYQEKWLLIQLREEDAVKSAVTTCIVTSILGFVSTVLTIILLLFEKGKWAEIITSLLSTICFVIMVALVQAVCAELTNVVDIAFVESGSEMFAVWGLWTILVVNALFTVTNILRHDKKVINYSNKVKERKQNA